MDWGDVSVVELLHSIRTDVDWGQPRGVHEFLLAPNRWSAPKGSANKWASRLKANAFHFRANYMLIFAAFLLLAFGRQPLALVGVLCVLLALLSTNDSFAAWVNDQLLRLIRRVHAPTALKIRARTPMQASPLSTPHASRRRAVASHKVHILAVPRVAVVVGLLVLALLLLRSSAYRLLVSMLLGLGLPFLHASLRSPNLKVKLANAADEFRREWRGYQEQFMMGTVGGLGTGGWGSVARGYDAEVNGGGAGYTHSVPDYTR